MTTPLQWTPMGCGASAMDAATENLGKAPDFPNDLVNRAEHLDLGVEPVFFAWEIARLAQGISETEHRSLMLLLLALQVAGAEGSTRLPLCRGGRLDRALGELQANPDERAAIESLLKQAAKAGKRSAKGGIFSVIGRPGEYRPLIIDHDCLYIQKLHVLEERVGRALRERIDGMAGGRLDKALEKAALEVFDSPPVGAFGRVELDAEQKAAVRAALFGRIAIVSGRPGSGKTSIVASVLRVLARIGDPPLESMALAAPTGKAADRMRQSISNHLAAIQQPAAADLELAQSCPASSTLHRLLGYSPGSDRFQHNENNPLSEQLVIVDESSMIDLAMMDRLLRALRPEARVIFLGDADQLPSIEAGAVLRDLCQARAARDAGRVVVLKKSYRAREEDSSGKRILDVAAAINEGVSPSEAGGGKAMAARRAAFELLFEGVEHLRPGNLEQRREFFSVWRDRFFGSMPDLEERLGRVYEQGPSSFDESTTEALRRVLSHYERYRILCVTRVPAGGTGSLAVNADFHQRRLDFLRGRSQLEGSPHFLIGEPVLVTRNDYALRLYNGDSGLVLRVAPTAGTRARPAEPMAVFPHGEGFVAYPLEALRGRLELAWATTVHKAQGSEYENVAVLLPEVPVRPLTRELLYTAVTRAKSSVVIVGSGEVLQAAVKRGMDRASGVADALG